MPADSHCFLWKTLDFSGRKAPNGPCDLALQGLQIEGQKRAVEHHVPVIDQHIPHLQRSGQDQCGRNRPPRGPEHVVMGVDQTRRDHATAEIQESAPSAASPGLTARISPATIRTSVSFKTRRVIRRRDGPCAAQKAGRHPVTSLRSARASEWISGLAAAMTRPP